MDNQAYERNLQLMEQDMLTRMKKRNDLIEVKEYNKGLD
jgi:primosomal protein N''